MCGWSSKTTVCFLCRFACCENTSFDWTFLFQSPIGGTTSSSRYQVLRAVTSISEEWLKQTFDQIKKRYRGTTRKKQLELNFMPRFHWNGCVIYSADRMFVWQHTVAKSSKIVISSLPLIYLLTSAKMMLKVLYCPKAMEAIQVKWLLNTLFSNKHYYFVKHYRTTLLVGSCTIFLKVQSVDFHNLEVHCDWST